MFTTTDIESYSSLSVKCNPEVIEALKATYPAMKEPSYFSKKHWISIEMDGSIATCKLQE